MKPDRRILIPLLAVFLFPARAASRWDMKFFHDKLKSTFIIQDLACPAETHCVAAGAISENGRLRPTEVITLDGGATWTYSDLKEAPYSLFFLDESNGWMSTGKNVWRTEDGGQRWNKLSKTAGIEQLYFRDAQRGWAVGSARQVLQTYDGGKSWKPSESAAITKGALPDAVYDWIDFSGPRYGIILGESHPYGRAVSGRPIWMDPDPAKRARELPILPLVFRTDDGGKSWTAFKTRPGTGRLARVRLLPSGTAISLVRLGPTADFPTKVVRFDLALDQGSVVFERKDRFVTDVLPLPESGLLLATVEPPGKAPEPLIPGKLKMELWREGAGWEEMPVDYRAVAGNAVIAKSGAGQYWVATDTGMILKLVATGNSGTLPGTKPPSAVLSTPLPPDASAK